MKQPFLSLCLLTLAALSQHVVGQYYQDGNEGRFFAVAAPHSSYTAEYETHLLIVAKVAAEVTITYGSTTHIVNVPSNGTASHSVPHSMRVTDGVENKAVYITSDNMIAVHMAPASYAGPRIPDAAMLRPVRYADSTFFISSYHGDIECDRKPMAFYTVVATADNTDVEVYLKINGILELIDEFTISEGETYTKDSYSQSGANYDIDYTGAYITATENVAVYSGQGCAVVPNQLQWINQYYHESMPSEIELGSNFITLPYYFGTAAVGYEFRFVSTHDDTVIECLEHNLFRNLPAGEFYSQDHNNAHSAVRVTCSHPCLITQYATEDRTNGGPADKPMGGFMTVITPDGFRSDDIMFTTPPVTDQSTTAVVLTIIVESGPIADLYLNSESLADTLTWNTVNYDAALWAHKELTAGTYRLYTFNPANRFTAYLHTSDDGGNTISLGYPLGYGVVQWTGTTTPAPTTSPTPTTTPATTTTPAATTTPVATTTRHPAWCTPPLYKIMLLGNFSSHDGSSFTPECNDDLNENLRDAASEKIPDLNAKIGVSLCSRFNEDDFQIVSVSTAFKTVGSQGSTEIAYQMASQNTMQLAEVYECGNEINLYLQNFTNWNLPIIPPENGCPQPVYDPSYFFDGSTGQDWLCLNVAANSVAAKNPDVVPYNIDRYPPGYTLDIHDNFTTMAGEELNAQCTSEYTETWEAEAIAMLLSLNIMLNDGTMCPAQQGRITLYTVTTSFTSVGVEGSIAATFYTQPTDDSMTFLEVCTCVGEIYDYVKDHSNWGEGPILDPPEGCPYLVFDPPDPPQFDHAGEKWACNTPQPTAVKTNSVEGEDSSSSMWNWLVNGVRRIV